MPRNSKNHEDVGPLLSQKRAVLKIICKVLVVCAIGATIGSTIYLGITLKNVIQRKVDNDLPSTSPLDNSKSVNEAVFDSFGPQMEILWRAALIANLILVLLFSLYILLAVIIEHYYAIMIFDLLLFCEVLLTCGTEYYAVSHYWTSIVYLCSAFIIHLYCHFLRLDILNELNAIKLSNHWRC